MTPTCSKLIGTCSMRFDLLYIFIPSIAVPAWLSKRLNAIVAERHPAAFELAYRKGQQLGPKSRGPHRLHLYRMLNDPVVDRHVRNLIRSELLIGGACVVGVIVAMTLNARS